MASKKNLIPDEAWIVFAIGIFFFLLILATGIAVALEKGHIKISF